MQSLLFAMCLVACVAKTLGQGLNYTELEFESITNAPWQWRSNASGNKTMRLEDPYGVKKIRFTLCAEPANPTQQVWLAFTDIHYANDGPSDTITLFFNNEPIGSVETKEKWHSGHEWNELQRTGRVTMMFSVGSGTYPVDLVAVTDGWGVELDKIVLRTDNQDPNVDIFCGAILIE